MTDPIKLWPISSSYGMEDRGQLARIDAAIRAQRPPEVSQLEPISRQERAKFQHDATLAAAPKLPPVSVPPSEPVPPIAGPWHLAWSDEFDGDLSKWNVLDNSTYGDGNNEIQTYMRANVGVANGALMLVAGIGPKSGFVTTRAQGGPQKFSYKHGYCEARIKCPSGSLYWPAFWLVGGVGAPRGWASYGEFDVMEAYGPRPKAAESNYHYGLEPGNKNIGGTAHNLDPDNTNWHTYGLNWTAERLEWWYDGVLVRSYVPVSGPALDALQYEHSFILNLALGGDGPKGYGWKPGDLSGLPGIMEIGYVRVWQRP